MTIYFKKEPTETIASYLKQEDVPAHEKIGAIYKNALSRIKFNETDAKEFSTLMLSLGVHPEDEIAEKEMIHLLRTLGEGSHKIVPTQNTGVYFIQKQDDSSEKEECKNVAVIKISRKRAAIETTARFLAYQLGLDRQMIPGMFCALVNPPLFTDTNKDETVEELWNSLEKIYKKQDDSHSSEIDTEDSSETNTEDDQLLSPREKGVNQKVDDLDFFENFNSDDRPDLSGFSAASLLAEESTESESESSLSGEDYFSSPGTTPPSTSSALNIGSKAKVISSETEDESFEEGFERTACAVVGIVQPFLQESEEASTYDYTLMTMFALAIGLRDGKKDGYKGSTFFDVEDCFPIRMDPVFTPGVIEKSASAIDLPYLDQDVRTNTSLSLEEVSKLADMVQHWKINKIIQELGRLKIQYEDKSAEKMKDASKGLDEGNCPVQVVKGQPPHLINGHLNHLTEENQKRRILLPDQLEACNTRLQRMRDFIVSRAMMQKSFTPRELVHAVDRWGKIYEEAIHHSPSLPREVDRVLKTEGTFHITGRKSPDDVKVDIGKDAYREHSATTPPTPPLSRLVAALEQSAMLDMPPLEDD